MSGKEMYAVLYKSMSVKNCLGEKRSGGTHIIRSIRYSESDRTFNILFEPGLNEEAIKNFVKSYPQEEFK